MSFTFERIEKRQWRQHVGDEVLMGNNIRITSKSIQVGVDAIRALGITPEKRSLLIEFDRYSQAIRLTQSTEHDSFMFNFSRPVTPRSYAVFSNKRVVSELLKGDYTAVDGEPGVYVLAR